MMLVALALDTSVLVPSVLVPFDFRCRNDLFPMNGEHSGSGRTGRSKGSYNHVAFVGWSCTVWKRGAMVVLREGVNHTGERKTVASALETSGMADVCCLLL